MARAWTSSRSLTTGPSPNDALIGIADTLSDELSEMGQERIGAVYRQQTSNASIAMEKERQALGKFMDENRADPSSWRTNFAKNKEAIRKSVMAGITQPKAKQAVELELNKWMAQGDGWLEQQAAKQTAANTNADWVVGRAGFDESRQYRDDTDMRARLAAAQLHIEHGFNGSDGPVDALPTRGVADAEKRKVTQSILGDYLVQQSLMSGDDSMIDQANEVAPLLIGEEQKEPLFGPEELAKIKGRVKAASDAARTEANKAKTDRVAAKRKQIAVNLIRGNFNIDDGKGNQINILDSALNDPDFSASDITETENLYEEKTKEGKPTTVEGRLEAYGKVNQAWMDLKAHKITQEEADKILHENLLTLDEEDAEMFIEKIGAGPKANESDADKRSDALQQDALTIINPAIEKWARNILGAQKDTSALLQIKGDFAKRLRDAVAPEIASGEKVDRAKLYEEAITIFSQMQDERKLKKEDKEQGGGSKFGWLMRNTTGIGIGISTVQRLRGTGKQSKRAQNQPTAMELRQQNTREAHEKGIELGYWK